MSNSICRRPRRKETFISNPQAFSSTSLFMAADDGDDDAADENNSNIGTADNNESDNSFSTDNATPVTEEMVLDAVEKAEKAWEVALESRKTANALIDRAEEEAEAASIVALETEKMVDDNQKQKVPVTMQQLAQVDRAANASLDATSKVNRAVKASQEADRLEKIAEDALQESERLLEEQNIAIEFIAIKLTLKAHGGAVQFDSNDTTSMP